MKDEHLDDEERRVEAFLSPLSQLTPAGRSVSRRRIMRLPKAVVAMLAVVALGGGAAVAATTGGTDPTPITVINQDGSTHPALLCPAPDLPVEPGTEANDQNGIPGVQPGEKCPTFTSPEDEGGSKGRGQRQR